jgi:hypothetical protein
VVVNGPKSWSLAAALHPDIGVAFDAAQDRAAAQILGWLGEHATTRVGPAGGQVQVPVARLEAVTVRHYTSRVGDPHRHLHLQINAGVFGAGKWRGLHTIGVRDSLAAINGIGHAAVATDPQSWATLAAHGCTLNTAGEIRELAEYVGLFSARAAQIGRNTDRYEREWTAAHPDESPGPVLRAAWDRRAWAEGRPDKVTPRPGADVTGRWLAELADRGARDRRPAAAHARRPPPWTTNRSCSRSPKPPTSSAPRSPRSATGDTSTSGRTASGWSPCPLPPRRPSRMDRFESRPARWALKNPCRGVDAEVTPVTQQRRGGANVPRKRRPRRPGGRPGPGLQPTTCTPESRTPPPTRHRPGRRSWGGFEREVDPDGVLDPRERARRAEHARKAYFLRLALSSAHARAARRAGGGPSAAEGR